MVIRTYQGTEFSISAVEEGVKIPGQNCEGLYLGDLLNPQDLERLATIIEWGEQHGVELDFSID